MASQPRTATRISPTAGTSQRPWPTPGDLLFQAHRFRVYNICYVLMSHADDAADAAQETFTQLLRRLPALTLDGAEMEAYVCAVARNTSLRFLRQRRKRLSNVRIEDELRDLRASVAAEPASVLDQRHASAEVRALLACLPARQRRALFLYEYVGLPYREIGTILGMTENAVAQLVFRARAGVARQLDTERAREILRNF